MAHTQRRPIFKVDFSEKNDDPLDFAFRHCRIEERDGERLVRTFTGKVPRSQSTRKRAKQDIARWCELHPTRLPKKMVEPSCSTLITYGNPRDVGQTEPVL